MEHQNRIIAYSAWAKSGGASMPIGYVAPRFRKSLRETKTHTILIIPEQSPLFERPVLDTLMEQIAEADIHAATFGFRGMRRWNGLGWTPRMREKPEFRAMIEDARAALNAIAATIPCASFTLMGFGLGASAASCLLEIPTVHRAIMIAPQLPPDADGSGEVAPNAWDDSVIYRHIGAFTGAALVLRDESAETEQAEIAHRLFDAAQTEHKRLDLIPVGYRSEEHFAGEALKHLTGLILPWLAYTAPVCGTHAREEQ